MGKKSLAHSRSLNIFLQILEEMDQIIEANPELEIDLIAYSIAFDYRLLKTLFSSRENVTRYI